MPKFGNIFEVIQWFEKLQGLLFNFPFYFYAASENQKSYVFKTSVPRSHFVSNFMIISEENNYVLFSPTYNQFS